MQFSDLLNCEVKEIGGKYYVELPTVIAKKLDISEGDHLHASVSKGQVLYWKAANNVPEDIYLELSTLFKGDETLISKWLATQRSSLHGKSALDLINDTVGLSEVRGLIKRMQTGDFS